MPKYRAEADVDQASTSLSKKEMGRMKSKQAVLAASNKRARKGLL
jgi:hypothetical protein